MHTELLNWNIGKYMYLPGSTQLNWKQFYAQYQCCNIVLVPRKGCPYAKSALMLRSAYKEVHAMMQLRWSAKMGHLHAM